MYLKCNIIKKIIEINKNNRNKKKCNIYKIIICVKKTHIYKSPKKNILDIELIHPVCIWS